MAKRKKKKVEPTAVAEPRLTSGQYYWCVNCGHHGDFGFHRKNSVVCEICDYDDVTIWTLEEINDPFLDNIWLERFKTRKQIGKGPQRESSLKGFLDEEKIETVKEKLAAIRGIK